MTQPLQPTTGTPSLVPVARLYAPGNFYVNESAMLVWVSFRKRVNQDLMSTASRACAFAVGQAEKAPINHKAAKPNDANDTGRRTGPFPISDRMRASIDATNPNGTSERSGGPLLRAFLSIATSTKNPTKEARTKPLNTLIFLQSEKRGCVFSHRTQAQIREGTGRMYPAKPIRTMMNIKAPFLVASIIRVAGERLRN